jgi:hypothetical protein
MANSLDWSGDAGEIMLRALNSPLMWRRARSRVSVTSFQYDEGVTAYFTSASEDRSRLNLTWDNQRLRIYQRLLEDNFPRYGFYFDNTTDEALVEARLRGIF